SVHNEVAVGSRQDRIQPDIPDQHVISFEVCVANRYKLNKKYKSLSTQLDESTDDLSLRTAVSQAKISADAENEDNHLEQKRQQGKKVSYGQSSKKSAKHCQFKIMPRYKVKAEGDVVQIDDQIVLESVKSPGQYLHVSKLLLGIGSIYNKSYELNLSVQQSGFTLLRRYKPSPDDENKIKVGDAIRFYHKEMEAYMVAEGLFDDVLTEDVHLRLRPIDQSKPKTLFPSSSAVTYWQVELEEGPVIGGILKWEQQCRIIHMCSRKYLVVDKGHVTLTANHDDPQTVFRLHPVIRVNSQVNFKPKKCLPSPSSPKALGH
ncbi:hypothetical protein ScPMuIL_018455, partial [Solemya velum]